MNRTFALTFSLLCSLPLLAQLPVVNQPVIFAPTDTVYLSPTGSDLNTGTISSPLKTFYAAMQHISWGVPNVNGGNNYGEVVLLPGDYYPAPNQGFVQTVNEWRQNVASVWVYKNVGIRGMANVRIHGDSMSALNQMIFLMGSHVKVSNLTIMNSKLHGVYFNGSCINHHSDILVDSVIVDGAIGFGIFSEGYDRVMVQRSVVNNTCRENANEVNNTCLWPSGLRADNCNHVTYRNNIVSHNWGEGLNTSYCRYVDVTDNTVFDNYSVNIYCHSASKAMYRNNLVYNSDSTYWRYCYGSNGSSPYGISVANELSCTYGCAFYTNGCGSSTSCCSYTDYDNSYTSVTYYMTDSIFIYNNMLFEAGINVWDAFSGLGNYAYINHLYIEHNTIIGRAGSAAINKAPIILTLGTGYIWFANVKVRNNIFAMDNTIPNASSFFAYAAAPACNGAWTNNFTASGNLWRSIPNVPGVSFAADAASATVTPHAVAGDTANLTPSPQHPELVLADPSISYITDDYFHHTRTSTTNAGAVEYDVNNGTQSMAGQTILPSVFPNPVGEKFTLMIPPGNDAWNCTIINSAGQVVYEKAGLINSTEISTAGWGNGIYIAYVSSGQVNCNLKVVVCEKAR